MPCFQILFVLDSYVHVPDHLIGDIEWQDEEQEQGCEHEEEAPLPIFPDNLQQEQDSPENTNHSRLILLPMPL